MDKDKLVLETWYAGTLNIKRDMIASVAPDLELASVIYAGPTDLSTWGLPEPTARVRTPERYLVSEQQFSA